MNAPLQPNDEQAALWNGLAGHAWVEAQEMLDAMLEPLEDLLVEVVSSATPRRVLDVGWADVDLRPFDVACTLPEKALDTYVTRFGPLGRVLHEADEAVRTPVIRTVRAAFDPYVHADEVRFTAALWLVGARGSSASAAPQETTR